MKSPTLFFTVWWLIGSAVQAALLSQLELDPKVYLSDALLSNFLLALICYALTFTLRSYQPGASRSYYLIFWVFILALFCVSTTQGLLKFMFSENVSYQVFLRTAFYMRLYISILMIGTSVLLSWMWNFMNERKEDESRRMENIRLVREAELISLRQQLQPHFLFNTLNSISALTLGEPGKARQMIQQLSDFFRMTLKKSELQMVTLEEELEYLELYLDIEKVRFGYRLETLVNCGEETLKMKLPALLLQPIVENAIKFGLYETLDTVRINITSSIRDSFLVLSVENPYDPTVSAMKEGTGFGLKGVSRRLNLLFFRNDLLQLSSEGERFTVTLKIPLHEKGFDH